jgi:hypothetical protein
VVRRTRRPAATVPATVPIPANEATASFYVVAVDDATVDGAQTVQIGGYVLASETCALDMIGARFVREIENGEIVGRVKDTMISGNFYEALGTGLAALGSEGSWVEGVMYTPPIYLNSVSIASKQ